MQFIVDGSEIETQIGPDGSEIEALTRPERITSLGIRLFYKAEGWNYRSSDANFYFTLSIRWDRPAEQYAEFNPDAFKSIAAGMAQSAQSNKDLFSNILGTFNDGKRRTAFTFETEPIIYDSKFFSDVLTSLFHEKRIYRSAIYYFLVETSQILCEKKMTDWKVRVTTLLQTVFDRATYGLSADEVTKLTSSVHLPLQVSIAESERAQVLTDQVIKIIDENHAQFLFEISRSLYDEGNVIRLKFLSAMLSVMRTGEHGSAGNKTRYDHLHRLLTGDFSLITLDEWANNEDITAECHEELSKALENSKYSEYEQNLVLRLVLRILIQYDRERRVILMLQCLLSSATMRDMHSIKRDVNELITGIKSGLIHDTKIELNAWMVHVKKIHSDIQRLVRIGKDNK